MGIRDLQDFIETDCQSACKPVDLLKIGRTYQTKRRGKSSGRLRLIVDAESCLDRLYGGFYSDWACGGQWNRMTHFLGILIQACQSANMELVVFFNGAFETDRLSEWAEQMVADKKKVASVLKHIHHKATPPPKVWWLPPVCLRQCLRMSLRQMGVTVVCSMDDHHQEVIAYCRENNFHGLLGQDADYAIFDPPRYFSSHNLKLTYKQALETKEYMMDEVAQLLDLNPKRFCVLATLLGNHILSEKDMKDFFDATCVAGNKIKDIADYVRKIESVDDLDAISKDVFDSSVSDYEGKRLRFKKSVQYYMNGTQDGFLNYKPKGIEQAAVKLPGSYPSKPEEKKADSLPDDKAKDDTTTVQSSPEESLKDEPEAKEEKEVVVNNNEVKAEEEDDEPEDNELTDLKADSYYTEAESGYAKTENPEIVVNSPTTPLSSSFDEELPSKVSDLTIEEDVTSKLEESPEKETEAEDSPEGQGDTEDSPEGQGDTEEDEEEEEKKNSPKPVVETETQANGTEKPPEEVNTEKENQPAIKVAQDKNKNASINGHDKTPPVSPEIMRIASERHQKGLMSAWIYQVLSQAEVKMGITLEDENSRELPSAVELYRTIRQNVYAILFDMNKRRPNAKYPNAPTKDVNIREWTIPRGSSVPRAELVKARPLDWKVPTVRRLWLGQAIEDKNRRLRAFLSCMKADNPRMLNIYHVPQHLLIMACVLRYMVLSRDVRVLRKHELDAFLCASVSPLLHDVETMQEMKLPMITSRGAQLAALFMRGVETAIFANDACGAPIPWSMCCPWLFFDGKLFHFKLLKANNNTPLLDMCDGQMDQMMRVERLRGAILDAIPIETLFAKPGLPLMQPPHYGAGGPYFNPPNDMNFRPAGASPNTMGGGPVGGPLGRGVGRGRGLLGRSPVDSRGGQLQIAGVVVGNWGPNVQANQARPGSRPDNDVAPPHVTAVGPRQGGLGGGRGLMRGQGGRMPPPRPGSSNNAFSSRNQPGMPRYNSTATKSGLRGNMRPVRGSLNTVRTKSRIRGPAGYSPKVTLEQKIKAGPAGRGCTVENPLDNSVISVSELMSVKPKPTKPEQGDDCDCGQFVDAEQPAKHPPEARVDEGQGEDCEFGQFYDAEPVKHAEVKVNLDQDDDQQIGTWVPWNHSE